MKTSLDWFRRRPMFRLWLAILALAAGLPPARAGLTVEIHLYNNNNFYFAYGWLSANATPPDFPVGTYFISSPQPAAAGTTVQYQSSDGATLNYVGGGGTGVSDFPSLMQVITNGDWTILVTNATSTNTYTFAVSAPVLPTNLLAGTTVTFPGAGATDVTNQPTFAWTGPLAWEGALNVSDYTNDASGNGYTVVSASLPPAQTSWPAPSALPIGTNTFSISYTSNATAVIVASKPTSGSAGALEGWVSTSVLESYTGSVFSVGAPPPAGGEIQGHTLMAHYTLASGSGYYQADSSGNNNNINGGSSWVSSPVWGSTNNAIAGGGALVLDGGENVSLGSPPGNQSFDNWLATFYGSFSISLWVNTTNLVGNDADDPNGGTGASILWAYYNGVNDTIPIALTGHKAAFFTGAPAGSNGDTLHSTNNVTTGSWVHIVVTRDESSGLKTIYINGALDSSDVGTTNHLDGDTGYYAIGGVGGSSYAGFLDDVQIYTGVLNSNEVAYLYANPGMTATNVTGSSSGLLAYYDFDEGTELAADLSANGNNLIYSGNFGGPVLSSDSISGSGAVYFNGGGFLTPSTNLLPILASNFSLSIWVKTTQNTAWNTAPAFYGAGIVAADVPGVTDDLVPVALTGNAIGFNTGAAGGSDDTINSVTGAVNDGNYHHVVVTRDQATGVKQIYIDGALSSSDTAGTGLLNAPKLITIGALADAGNPDPASPENSGNNGFVGLLDDIQVYSRVLTPTEVASLHTTPGSSIANGLVVHYDFDEGTVLAADKSGHGNNMVFAGSFSGPGPAVSSDAQSGAGALSFDGGSYLVPENNLVTNLAGSFSLSAWLKTTQTNGAGIVTAEVQSRSFDLAPLTLTGGDIAFQTDGFSSDTLTSTTPINDGHYHHVVVTRNQVTGAKQIYIDGALNNSDVADTALLNNPQILIFGAFSDASQSYQNSPTSGGTNGYVGLMDDAQIYSRVLSSTEVAFLYANPGMTLPVASAAPLGAALGAPNLTWSTSGDTPWFAETTNTYSTNAAAAQSGSLQDGQSSVLQTTVTGPCIISFYWQTTAGNDNFDLEFDMDGSYQNDISGQTPWQQYTLEIDDSNIHTLRWNANTIANSGSSPTDAGFLDQFVITPEAAPVITLNPFNQTNYPGYSVALLAAATGTPAPSWQWYQVGNPNPISGATSALFIPTNSGQSSVAGGYYAVASNPAGSQTTTTALVAFVSLPLPPDWSEAFKSPFENSDNYGIYSANDVYFACAVDSTGANIYSVGNSTGTNFFGTTEILGGAVDYAAVIVKQTAAKAALWVVSITNNGNGSAYAEEVAPAPGGGVYAAGGFTGTNWLGNTLLQDSGEGTYFLARLDANGNLVWMQTVSNAFPFLNDLVADPSGNVTLAVEANGSTTIGGSNLTVGGMYLAQFNDTGTLHWVEHFPQPIFYLQYSAGRVYASIPSESSYTVAGVTSSTDRNWTVAAINATNGQGIWLRGVGEALGTSNPNGLVDDYPEIAIAGSNVFLVGTAYGSSAVFGSFTLPLADGRGQYFARYDTNGNAQLATGFGSATTQPQAAVADADGNVYVAGNFDTYAWFGNDLLAAPRLNTLTNSYYGHAGYFGQAFAAKFDRTGTPQWARMAEATNLTFYVTDLVNFYDIALAPNGVWVCGEGNGAAFFGTNLVNSAHQLFVIGTSLYALEYNSGMLGMIAETASAAPVTLLNPAVVGGTSFQFQFLSQEGFTHNILYQTNIAAAGWLTNSTVAGDGTVKTISIPLSTFSPSRQGYVRILTQ